MADNHGFTLLEVLVAFAIFALVAVTGIELAANSLARISHVENRAQQIEAAKALLAGGEQSGLIDSRLRRRTLARKKAEWTDLAPILVSVPGTNLETIVIGKPVDGP
jgi:prepilin-type N-terminal cleavage/methylation domain-containing protein